MHRPRIERIHHLTIAVPSLEGALDLWRDALGVSPDIREFPEHQMREAAFPIGELEVRLWQATGTAGDSLGLRQIGLQVTKFDDAVAACCTLGLRPSAPAPASRPQGRRKRLVQVDGVGPALELLEARPAVANVPPVRLTRALTRSPKRQAPGPRARGAKPPVPPPDAAKTVKTARAPRPPVRPRGTVSRGGKKK
jgi:catechol 2,3-dioxygenase-like lactoylglutathione lyase family enzyme